MRAAGAVVALEGATSIGIALVILVRELVGAGDAVIGGFALAGIFAVLGGGTAAAGVALARGRRGGRAPSVIVQIILTPVVWSLLTASGIAWAGVLLGVAVLVVVVGAFAPSSLRWTGERFAEEHPPVPDREPAAEARPLSPRAARGRSGPRR